MNERLMSEEVVNKISWKSSSKNKNKVQIKKITLTLLRIKLYLHHLVCKLTMNKRTEDLRIEDKIILTLL